MPRKYVKWTLDSVTTEFAGPPLTHDATPHEKIRARVLVKIALKRGWLKEGPCEKCVGAATNIYACKLVAHHDDYSKPLDVRWLCYKHHIERHWELGWGHTKRLSDKLAPNNCAQKSLASL